MKRPSLAPSLMCADLLNLEEQLGILQKHRFDYLHIDIMDGHFVPNITFGFDFVNKIDEMTALPKEVHLMMDHPELALKYIGVNESDIITFHIECKSKVGDVINLIKDRGGKVGLAISPSTPIDALYPYLQHIDSILVMTIQPGFAGQPFVQGSHDRVLDLAATVEEQSPHITLGIDGAVGFEQIKDFGAMGVRHFVLGTSALFKGDLAQQARVVSAFVATLHSRNSLQTTP